MSNIKVKYSKPLCDKYCNKCDGYTDGCDSYEEDMFGLCSHITYSKEIIWMTSTKRFYFEEDAYRNITLKIGNKDLSHCSISYLEVDGEVIIKK